MDEAGDRSFRFMFRTDRGRIDRAGWWRGTLPLAVLTLALSLGWTLVRPYARHDLSTTPFLAASTFAAFAYLILFTFALILIAVCEYNLSAKRFRDRGRPAALAAVLPLAIFGAGALIWFVPRSFGEVPDWTGSLALVAVAAILLWNLWDLGLGVSRRTDP